MKIIQIEKLSNGSHRNQSGNIATIPRGWAVVPKGLETPNFPFGEIEVSQINGVEVVTKWTATDIPVIEKTEPSFTPSAQDDVDTMLVDHELRLTMIELGV